jgi:microcystin-dependent protein
MSVKVPSVGKYIFKPQVQFRAPDSESLMYTMAGTNNFILDHYIIWPGTIWMFGGPEVNVPTGWFPCDGRAVSRTTYNNLFLALSSGGLCAWGHADGATAFNVPDFRGLFPRMVSTTLAGASGRDPGESSRSPSGDLGASNVGSVQQDALRAHNHSLQYGFQNGGSGVAIQSSGDSSSPPLQTTAFGGSESRPKNAYVMFMVKW